MKKIKLLFALLAAVAGVSGAIASNHSTYTSSDIRYNWLNWDDEIVLLNATQAQAQMICYGNYGICLRAQGNTGIFTIGEQTFAK